MKARFLVSKKNLKVLDEVSESRKFIKALKRIRVKLIGHLLKHNEFVTNIIECKVFGKRGRASTILMISS